jgi:hypothetical protein
MAYICAYFGNLKQVMRWMLLFMIQGCPLPPNTHTHTHTHTHIYIYIYTHTHTHTYIYIYTHTHTHNAVSLITIKLLNFVHRPDFYKQKTQRFGNWICFSLQARGGGHLLYRKTKACLSTGDARTKVSMF